MSTIDAIFFEAALVTVVVVFLAGAIGKVRAWGDFVAAVAAYRVVPVGAAGTFAVLLVGLEVTACCLLATPALRWVGGAAGALVIVAASAGVAINLCRGRNHIECGCGGFARGTLGTGGLSWWLVMRNAALLALVVLAAVRAPNSARVFLQAGDGAAAAASALVAVMLYATASQLISNHVVMRRREG